MFNSGEKAKKKGGKFELRSQLCYYNCTANSQASISFSERRSEADKKPIEKQTID